MKAADKWNLKAVIANPSSLLFVSGTAGSSWLLHHELSIKKNEMLELAVLASYVWKEVGNLKRKYLLFYDGVLLDCVSVHNTHVWSKTRYLLLEKLPVFLNM